MADAIQIPGYKIIRALGKGGMAAVYLAIQESFEREVALKVMNASLAADEKFTDRFLREAQIVSRLIHPNIVTVYDVGVHENLHYLSMEYVPGQDLKSRRRGLALSDSLQVIKDIAKALDYAGRKGFVHRDVKPENIMLHEEEGRAVLMDFGIACMADTASGMTQTGTAIGTPHYMSPEQAKGRPVDPRSDIYSLGVVMFLLLVGYVPYDADSAVAVGIKHVSEAIPRLPRHLQLLQPVVDKVMAKDPNERYQTGSEFIAALDQITADDINAMETLRSRQIAPAAEPASDGNAPTVISNGVPATKTPAASPNKTTVSATALGAGSNDDGAIERSNITRPVPAVGDSAEARKKARSGTQQRAARARSVGHTSGVVESTPSAAQRRNRGEEVMMLDAEDRIAHDHAPPSRRRWPWAMAASLAALVAAGVVWREQLPPPVRGAVNNTLAAGSNMFRAVGIPVEAPEEISVVDTPVATAQPIGTPVAPPAEQSVEPQQESPAENAADSVGAEAQDTTSMGRARSLREELERDISVAPQLAKLYRDVLAESPGDKRAEFGLQELRDYHYRNLETALDERDMEHSQAYLDSFQASFPDIANEARFQELAETYQRAEQAQAEIDKGQEFLVQNALMSPPEANALAAFRSALEIDPGNPRAEAGIERIVERYLALVEEENHKGNYEDAVQLAKRGLSIAPDNAELIKLQKSAAGQLDHQLKLENLRITAQTQMQDGNLITPRGESALDRYRELLTLNPDSSAAQTGIAEIERRLARQIEDLINASDFPVARNTLFAAREAFPSSDRLLALEVSLDRAIEADIIARQPKIPQILVSNAKPDSINTEQKTTLNVDRTIYIGFSYDNFVNDTSVVQAILYDSSRDAQIAQVPVIVSGKDGVKFFSIDRPVEGFLEGGYHIDLMLSGDRLSTLAFRVDRSAIN